MMAHDVVSETAPRTIDGRCRVGSEVSTPSRNAALWGCRCLVGLAVAPVGLAATIGIVGYFLGATAAVIHAGAYRHIPFPLMYLVPVLAAAALGAAV
jgi:hypothetical protein